MPKPFWICSGLLVVGTLVWAKDEVPVGTNPLLSPPASSASVTGLRGFIPASESTGRAYGLSLERGGAAAPTPCPPALPKLEATRDLPADARKLLDGFQEEAKLIRQKAEDEVATRGEALAIALKTLQDQYTREAKLDEAVAIRDLIRKLKAARINLQADPGNLSAFYQAIGQTFYFEVTGATSGGSVWGTEVYTYDSRLAIAAVHSGALKDGETGIVEVTLLNSPDSHKGSTANGVTTSSWGVYSASYTVKRWTGSKPAQPTPATDVPR